MLKKIIAVAVIIFALAGGVVAYNFLKTPEAASGPIQAIPLAQTTAGSSSERAATVVTSPEQGEQTTAIPPVTAAPTQIADVTVTAIAAETADAPATAAAAAIPSGAVVAQIVPEESEARFIIDEVLNNAPKTVVGTTNQVAGEIAIDAQDPSKTRVGIIQVNARTLTTDSNMRNRAIKNQILSTDQYEFITFTPSETLGLPQSGTVGESYTFQLAGDLTIRDVTLPVTFDVTAKATSPTRFEGSAQTTIRYADYGIRIPQVRQVASVSDQVRLEIDFVAVAQ